MARPSPTSARQNRLLNTLEMRARKTLLESLPYSIQLEVTTKCNFACIMCARDKYHGAGENLTDDIRDIVLRDVFPTCQDVIVSSFGEPLLYPGVKEIFERIDPKSGLELGFFTNVVLLTEEMAETIVRSGVGYLNASIDGATRETYELIRKGGKWDILCEKLELMQRVKQRMGSRTPRMNLCVVGSTLNVEEIPLFVEFASRHGFDSVKYNPNMYVDDEKMDYMSLVHEQEKTVRMFRLGQKKALELGMHSNFHQVPFDVSLPEASQAEADSDQQSLAYLANKLRFLYNQKVGWRVRNTWVHSGGSVGNFAKLFAIKGRDYLQARLSIPGANLNRGPLPHPIPNDAPPATCGNPWTHVHIKSDGLVYPCCFSDEVMGDLRKQSFDEIWNGKKYQALRKSLTNGKYWKTCRRASCNWVDGQSSSIYGAEIELLEKVTEIDSGAGGKIPVRITNTSRFTWETPDQNPITFVTLSYRLYNQSKELVDEGLHQPLPKTVLMGSSIDMDLVVKPLPITGDFVLKIDMVHEQTTWFGERGNNALEHEVRMTGAAFGVHLQVVPLSVVHERLRDALLKPGQEFELPVRLTNNGASAVGGTNGRDQLGVRWWSVDHKDLLFEDPNMTTIPDPVEPGERTEIGLRVQVPDWLEAGRYELEIDAFREGVGYCSLQWHRRLLAYPVRVASTEEDALAIPQRRANGEPYVWEPKGQCVTHTGNKGIW